MKKTLSLFLALSLVFIEFSFVQTREKPALAVLPLSPQNVTAADVDIITGFLYEELFGTGRFDLMERQKVDQLFSEMRAQQTGVCDLDCAVQIGSLLSAHKVVMGTVGKLETAYTLQVQLIDVESGTIEQLSSVLVEGGLVELPNSMEDLVQKLIGESDEDTPVVKAKKSRPEKTKRKGGAGWWVVGGLLVAGGVVAVLLLSKKEEEIPSGSIQIDSSPPGAQVSLDGINQSQTTPCTLSNISAGSHNLKLEIESYGKWEGAVVVVAGETTIVTATLAVYTYEFVTTWGSMGTGNGQFFFPYGVTVDSSGNVYVADQSNHRIQKFSSSGSYLTQWGSMGSGNGQFKSPVGVGVDVSGNIYVVDSLNHRIQKFSSSGSYITQWGSYGVGNDQFKSPNQIAIDSSGNIYVADSSNHRIQKFSSTGNYILNWGSNGSGNGQFNSPIGVSVDHSGNVYVADTQNHRIQKFSSSGSYITQWGNNGSGDGQFKSPGGIATDSSNNVYVADIYNHRIQKFSSSGSYITQWGSSGSGDGQFQIPIGVAINSSGNVYVTDYQRHRVQEFQIATETQQAAKITFSPLRSPAINFHSGQRNRPIRIYNPYGNTEILKNRKVQPTKMKEKK